MKHVCTNTACAMMEMLQSCLGGSSFLKKIRGWEKGMASSAYQHLPGKLMSPLSSARHYSWLILEEACSRFIHGAALSKYAEIVHVRRTVSSNSG